MFALIQLNKLSRTDWQQFCWELVKTTYILKFKLSAWQERSFHVWSVIQAIPWVFQLYKNSEKLSTWGMKQTNHLLCSNLLLYNVDIKAHWHPFSLSCYPVHPMSISSYIQSYFYNSHSIMMQHLMTNHSSINTLKLNATVNLRVTKLFRSIPVLIEIYVKLTKTTYFLRRFT